MHEVGIIGASGYTGGELLRLLCRHPSLRVGWATSRQHAGLPAGEVFTSLRDFTEVVFSAPDLARLPAGVEAVFVALPHVEAMSVVPALLERGLKVVDLSADFRLRDAAVYSRAYGQPHAAPALLAEAVYGLTEHARARVREARLVANPGCYPTATLLALLPLARRGLARGVRRHRRREVRRLRGGPGTQAGEPLLRGQRGADALQRRPPPAPARDGAGTGGGGGRQRSA